MITPLDLATSGHLDSPLSVAVTGHLSLADDVEFPKPPGSGDGPSYVQGTYEHPFVRLERLREQLEREDEEILAVIMTAMRWLQ